MSVCLINLSSANAFILTSHPYCCLVMNSVNIYIILIFFSLFSGVSVSVSCFTLVAISLERYFAICRPLHSRKWQTRSHSYKCIALCWFLAFAVCVPMAVNTKYRRLKYGNYLCKEIWDNADLKMAYDIFVDVILLLLPVIIMSVSYGKVAYTLWSGMKMDKHENGKTRI